MGMPLVDFEQNSQTGDSYAPKDAAGQPLLVKVLEHRTGVKTKFKPEGTDAVLLDVLNLATSELKLGVMWFNGALVDNLKPYLGKALPIRLVSQKAKGSTNEYLIPQMLDGADLEAAKAWASSRPNLFEEERTTRGWPQHMPQGMASLPQETSAPVAAQPPAAQPPAAAPVAAAQPPAAAPVAAAQPPAAAPAAAAQPPAAAVAPGPVNPDMDDDEEPPF